MKTDVVREYIIFQYWYFLKINVKFEPEVCNGFHSFSQINMSFNDVAIVYVKGNNNRIHFLYMNKYEAINILKDAVSTKKRIKT